MRPHHSGLLARGVVVALAALCVGSTGASAQAAHGAGSAGSPQPLFSDADWRTVQSYFAAHPDASWNDFAGRRSNRRR
jgi:hypothetical protein